MCLFDEKTLYHPKGVPTHGQNREKNSTDKRKNKAQTAIIQKGHRRLQGAHAASSFSRAEAARTKTQKLHVHKTHARARIDAADACIQKKTPRLCGCEKKLHPLFL